MSKSLQKVMIESLATKAGLEIKWEHYHKPESKRIEWYGISFLLNGVEIHKRFVKYLQPKQSYAMYNAMDGIQMELQYYNSLVWGD